MGWFGTGESDRHGRQKRIEHRGEYLRISRTGGISLRAQTRVAGVSATVNSRHGVRLSTRLARNTQVALQRGRFVLRGRYGTDAARLNLSKSGLTVSSRTPSGTFNWVRPARSSFKLAGVQVRGRKAVWLQLAHLLATVVAGLLRGASALTLGAGRLIAGRIEARRLQQAAADEAALLAELDDDARLARARAHLDRQELDLGAEPPRDLLAALAFGLVWLGRGETDPTVGALLPDVTQDAARAALHDDLVGAAKVLASSLPATSDDLYPAAVLLLIEGLAQALMPRLDSGECGELLLGLDDACLAAGPRTLLQQALLDRMVDCWGLELELEGEP